MAITINGSTGIAGVDGSAGTPALQGSDTNTGISFGSDVVIANTGGVERSRVDASGRLLLGTATARNYNGLGLARLQLEGTGYAASTLALTNNENAVDGSYIILNKSRGNSVGSYTVVQSGDKVGSIWFQGTDGTREVTAATIDAVVDGTPGNLDMPGRLVFSTTADGASSPTERMRIDNVGTITATATGAASNNFENTFASFTGAVLGINASRNTTNGSYNFLVCSISGVAVKFKILDSGNAQNANNSYGAISDLKLKENILAANSQWNDLKALQVRNYNFKEETGQQVHTQIGLIAQEVEQVSPGLVYESPDRDADGNDLGTVTKSVNYSVLYMKAVKALQEAMERIETLETRLTALEVTP